MKNIGILITVAIAIIGGTWVVNQGINDALIENLKLTIRANENDIAKLKEKIPGTIFISEKEKKKISPELQERFIEAEKRKNEIIKKIVLVQADIFDPSSEISSLANLLKSSNKDERRNAIVGFFEIKNPNTALYLSDYFFSHQGETTSGYMPSIMEWIKLFDNFGLDEGLLFCINLIKEGDYFNSRTGYRELNYKVLSGIDISKFESELKSIALMSKDPLKRTWAKTIQNNSDEIKKNASIVKDRRSLFNILLDIEKLLQDKQKGE